ncbi:undifferentiated embryonic cell transcription factor 1 [Macaca mulatta]|uniref:Undifferentiated embryonic cell transcription factor 1 n=1 Tax=Macaca mulatta TaxID=9544 RepID=A0A5F7ZUI6_MACMU|nr:undifferentiated embryonic cell transcription factor 1 [Macaca mulatta]XP_005566838.2 undifferentiated embryonic cell transcription factor 1 [Macaca fascicularis]
MLRTRVGGPGGVRPPLHLRASRPGPGMLLRPRRPPPLAPPAPPSPASPDPEPRPPGDVPGTPPRRPASPSALGELGLPVSPGSAQRTPWSAQETELLLGTLLQPAVWRALLLDRRQALPTYRRVSAALARQQVRRTPAQCRRRYKFLKDKFREAQGQPPGPFDEQIRKLMGLLGDNGRKRPRRRSPGSGRPQRGRRPAPNAHAPVPAEPDATPLPTARDPDADPAWTLRFSPSPPKSTDTSRAPGSPPAPAPTALATCIPEDRTPLRRPGSPPPPPAREDPDSPPGRPEDCAPPPAAPPSLNTALLQTLGHLGDIANILGPLRDQLLTLNQHVEQLRGAFDQTVSLAVGFILGSAAAERGVLRDPCQ